MPESRSALGDTAPFISFVADMEIAVKPIDSDTAFLAAQLRAKYQGIKAMDALQLRVRFSSIATCF